ncbi:MAG: dockerin type I domain-containing protein, partial [Candidatus Omnitrophica bacterium]|nr:dockerin type I domain-containing protein [Candidatus Omnitrophota bacterium]
MKTNKCMKVEQAILAVTGIMFFAVFFLYVVPAYGDMTPEEFNIAMGRDAGAPLPTALPFIRGDVNGDGVVNAADANILAQYLSGNHSLLASYDVGDVNA